MVSRRSRYHEKTAEISIRLRFSDSSFFYPRSFNSRVSASLRTLIGHRASMPRRSKKGKMRGEESIQPSDKRMYDLRLGLFQPTPIRDFHLNSHQLTRPIVHRYLLRRVKRSVLDHESADASDSSLKEGKRNLRISDLDYRQPPVRHHLKTAETSHVTTQTSQLGRIDSEYAIDTPTCNSTAVSPGSRMRIPSRRSCAIGGQIDGKSSSSRRRWRAAIEYSTE